MLPKILAIFNFSFIVESVTQSHSQKYHMEGSGPAEKGMRERGNLSWKTKTHIRTKINACLIFLDFHGAGFCPNLISTFPHRPYCHELFTDGKMNGIQINFRLKRYFYTRLSRSTQTTTEARLPSSALLSLIKVVSIDTPRSSLSVE